MASESNLRVSGRETSLVQVRVSGRWSLVAVVSPLRATLEQQWLLARAAGPLRLHHHLGHHYRPLAASPVEIDQTGAQQTMPVRREAAPKRPGAETKRRPVCGSLAPRGRDDVSKPMNVLA